MGHALVRGCSMFQGIHTLVRIGVSAMVIVTVASRDARAEDTTQTPSKAASKDAAAPTAAATGVAQSSKTQTEEAPAPSVFLHVRSSKTVTVEREDTGAVVCMSPCDKDVPGGPVRYHIGGH